MCERVGGWVGVLTRARAGACSLAALPPGAGDRRAREPGQRVLECPVVPWSHAWWLHLWCGAPCGCGCPEDTGACGTPSGLGSVPCSGASRAAAAPWRSCRLWRRCTGTGRRGAAPALAPAPAEEVWSPGGGSATTPGTGGVEGGEWGRHRAWWVSAGHLSPLGPHGRLQTRLRGASVHRRRPAGRDVQHPGGPAPCAGRQGGRPPGPGELRGRGSRCLRFAPETLRCRGCRRHWHGSTGVHQDLLRPRVGGP